ncbi:MAG: penicillin-binding protein 1C, partial [Chitinophagaceae bacterium]|nr:penicillin-binding protein 1C [Chitinophagaceae bacterium]
KFVQTLSDCDFTQVRKDQKKLGLSMILGGCGATLEQLTGMYSVFANDGLFSKPTILKSDSNGKRATRILSPAATYMINETLSKVNRPDFPLNWQSTERMPKIAWKTGTSYGRRDAWSIGYNKNFTIGIWVGNFSGEGVAELSGATIATPLLFKLFNSIDYDSDEEWFTQPSDCDIRKVCSETGMLPVDQCEGITTDYFIPLISSTRHCDNMEEILLSPDEKITYCKVCVPGTGYKKKWMKKITPDMQHYYDDHHIAYQKIPIHNTSCERVFKDGGPVITSPKSGTEYLISKKNPEPILLSCNAGNDVGKIYWYVNNEFYKTAAVGSKQFFVPTEGPVKISCTDDKGRNKDTWIRVRMVNL